MQRQLEMRGGRLGSFDTPAGIAFNVFAILHAGFMLWLPAGLRASFFIRDAIRPNARRAPFVVSYLLLCVAAFVLFIFDLGGCYSYIID